ncbi:glycosyltransferase [Streptomyces oryzae]|uniref:D-inositol 3-phosphate glycosyltransferase n=1 Tax=Streptomyces oryzae TaxID=1434886 RepID=A0ABS3XBW7_9ACTN|nr:glycosyltransferase [Streptomyces oryzae]
MRVLHIITGLGVGGAEEQLRLLLRHLPRHSVDSEVVTLTNPGALAEAISADGTRVTHLGMTGNRDLPALPRLVRLVRAGGYDLVHTHLYRAGVYGRIAARLAGVRPVVATEHSLGDTTLEGRPLTPAVRALYLATERLGTTTVAVSSTVAGRLRRWGVPAARLCTVPNGIDAARFRFDPSVRATVRRQLGIAPDVFVVAGVGRLVPGKRFGALLDAVAEVPGARLLLAGDGPERPALRTRAEELGVADRVVLLGECTGGSGAEQSAGGPVRPDVPGVLAAADVFVSPSAEESFGLAALEALAAGLPVLYAACPAVADLPPEQAPGARRFPASHEGLTGALRAAARATEPARLPVPPAVHHYDIAHCAERLARVYDAAHRTAHGTRTDASTALGSRPARGIRSGATTALDTGPGHDIRPGARTALDTGPDASPPLDTGTGTRTGTRTGASATLGARPALGLRPEGQALPTGRRAPSRVPSPLPHDSSLTTR